MKKGYLQVYTGNGKGKTTAALGLALRAAGRGFRVEIFQFLKGEDSGELSSAPLLGGRVTISRLAETKKFFKALNEDEKAVLKVQFQEELGRVRAVISDNSCDILILDEIMAALHGGLLTLEDLLLIIDSRPVEMELVLTGRAAPPEVIERADLVTEMVPVKHYYQSGVPARKGIEK